ncbi:MAG: hypothetical protein AAF363_17670 [Bacteroidota bacterium]
MSVRFSKQSISILSTLFLVGVGFSLYFFFYIPIQEKKIIQNNFRVLNRIVQNIHSLEESYIKNAEIISQNTKIDDVNNEIQSIGSKKPERLKTDGKGINDNIYYTDDDIIIGIKNKKGSSDDDTLSNSERYKYYSVNYSNFFNKSLLHRKDVFDQIIISKDGVPLYTNSIFSPLDTLSLNESRAKISIADIEYVSLNASISKDIFISGLISETHFNQEKRGVGLLVVISSTVILIFVILSMPLLKLKIMGNFERLHRSDVFFTGLSIVLGSAVLTILILWSATYFTDKKVQQGQLSELTSKIEKRFQEELQEIVFELSKVNTKYKPEVRNYKVPNGTADSVDVTQISVHNPNGNLDEIDKYEAGFEISYYRVFQNTLDNDTSISYKNFNAIFWSDNVGRGLVVLSPFNDPSYAQDLKHRHYLKDIINNTAARFTDKNDSTHKIAIESIKSVNDGRYETGIGYGTGNPTLPVIALSTKLGSIMEPILSEGFGFCIFDINGNTLFHSDIQKNINENFLDETGSKFHSAVLSQTEKCTEVTYGGEKRLIYLKPLSFLPNYYMATFQDSVQFNSPYSLAIHTTVVLYFFFVSVLTLFLLLIYILSLKSNKLKQHGFIFDWLRPRENEVYLEKYRVLFVVFIVSSFVIVFTGLMVRYQPEVLISALLLNTACLIFFSFHFLSEHDETSVRPKSLLLLANAPFGVLVVLLSVFSRFCFLQLSECNLSPQNDLFIILTLVMNIGLFIVLIGILLKAKIIMAKVKKVIRLVSRFIEVNTQTQYLYTTFCWVIIVSVIPICVFFGLSLSAEQQISKTYSSFLTYNRLLNWDYAVEQEYKGKFKNDARLNELIESRKKSNRHLYFIGAHFSEESDSEFVPHRSLRYFQNVYQLIRPFYNDYSRVSNAFMSSKGIITRGDSTCKERKHSWSLNQYRDKIRFDEGSSSKAGIGHSISLDRWAFKFTFLHILGLIALLLAYFQVHRFALIKIFGFEYKRLARKVSGTSSKDFGRKLVELLKTPDQSSYNNIFLVGVDASHVCYVKNELQENFGENFMNLNFYDVEKDSLNIALDESENSFDMKNIKNFNDQFSSFITSLESLKRDKIIVFVEHFEFAYNSKKLNRIKLHLLKYMVDRKNISVVISSEINATKLLDFYEDKIHELEAGLQKNPNANNFPRLKTELEQLEEDSRKWQHVLGSFAKIILPMRKFDDNHEQLQSGDYHDYIMRLAPFDGPKLDDDDKILTVQEISYPFYFAIWNSLSKHERYIVYDIARDNFVNTSNVTGIQNLLNKGILVYDDSLRLMNDSFTNFVLSKVNSDEALEMEMESRKKGAWGSVSIILILLIVSLMVFLYFGQQSVIYDLSAVVTSLGAILGFLIRFGGIFSFGGSKGSSHS